MLSLLREAWDRNPDQRLGQLVGNAGREPKDGDSRGRYRDPFYVADEEMSNGLRRMARGAATGAEDCERNIRSEVNASDRTDEFETEDTYPRMEAVLLDYVIEEFPTPVTLFEAATHLRRDPHNRLHAEEVDLVSRQLTKAGLLYRVALDAEPEQYAFPHGNRPLRPTKAALHGRALLDELAGI
jgi:hypothetical protein